MNLTFIIICVNNMLDQNLTSISKYCQMYNVHVSTIIVQKCFKHQAQFYNDMFTIKNIEVKINK